MQKTFYVKVYAVSGISDSETIDRCLADAAREGTCKTIVFDGRDYRIDRAVLVPSDTEIVIDNCTVKQNDYVFRGDNLLINGIDFRSGCHHCVAENITGFTSDDTVACTALSQGRNGAMPPRYLAPLEPYNASHENIDGDIHHITVRGIRTGGYHPGVIRLAAHGNRETAVDLVICQLSTNDATRRLPLAQTEEAIRFIVRYARDTWGCPVVFYTGTYYQSDAYADMVALLHRLRKECGYEILDLYNDAEMRAVSEDDYARFMDDPIHPNLVGYREWWTPKFIAFCEKL